jgi:hypothetical protein
MAKCYQNLTAARHKSYLQILYKQVSQQSTISWKILPSSQISPELADSQN